jgi:hypothetical protein
MVPKCESAPRSAAAFPAPTGIVDYELRKAGDQREWNIGFEMEQSARGRGDRATDVNLLLPLNPGTDGLRYGVSVAGSLYQKSRRAAKPRFIAPPPWSDESALLKMQQHRLKSCRFTVWIRRRTKRRILTGKPQMASCRLHPRCICRIRRRCMHRGCAPPAMRVLTV